MMFHSLFLYFVRRSLPAQRHVLWYALWVCLCKQVNNLSEQAKVVQQSKQLVHFNLLTSGGLNEYLAGIDGQAEDLFSRMVKEYADKQGITEQLKEENQLLWVQKMNNIWACVREVVEIEIIYS